LKYAPKDNFYTVSYAGRVYFSCCVWNMGWQESIKRIFEGLGLKVSDSLAEFLLHHDKEREKDKVRAASDEDKRKRSTRAMQQEAAKVGSKGGNLYGQTYLDDLVTVLKSSKEQLGKWSLQKPPASKVALVEKKLGLRDEKEEKKTGAKLKKRAQGASTPGGIASPPRKKQRVVTVRGGKKGTIRARSKKAILSDEEEDGDE
jgi:hypothetical protein